MTLETTIRTLATFQDYLDQLLEVTGFEVGSNGLVLAGRTELSKVGLAVNCSFQAIEAALKRNSDMLITHHAAWTSTDAHLAQQKHEHLRQLEIGLYVAHDCLDCAAGFGTGYALARAVQLSGQEPFSPDGELPSGVHGTISGNFPQFVRHVGNRLGIEPRTWKNSDRFGHVGIMAGWGGRPEWMARAQALGCDTILTGEANLFGILFAREAGLNLILAGHYATEVPGVMALGARIAQDQQLDVTFIPEDIIEW